MHPWGLSLDLNLGTVAPSGDPTLLSSTILTTLGVTTTRTGSQLHYPARSALSAGNFAEIGVNEPVFTPVEIAGTYFSALLPQANAAGLLTYSNRLDNAAWTKTNCTAEWVADVSSAFGGYTLITATANNATITRTLARSSANRRSLILADVPAGNAGDVRLSQDNGSTQITLPDGFAETELAAVTSSNPTLHLELTNSGDTCRAYDITHQEPSAGVPVHRWLRPSGASAESVGAASYVKTLSVAPTEVDISVLVTLPRSTTDTFFAPFELYNSAAPTTYFTVVWFGSTPYLIRNAPLVQQAGASTTPGDVGKLDVQWSATDIRARFDNGSWFSVVHIDIPVFDRLRVGNAAEYTAGSDYYSPIIAIRDNNGQIFQQVQSAVTVYEDDFSTDTSSEWSFGMGAVDGVKAITGGVLQYTRGAGDANPARLIRPITGLTVGKFAKITGTIGGTGEFKYLSLTQDSGGVAANGEFQLNGGTFYVPITASTMYLTIQVSPASTGTITLDDVSVEEVTYKPNTGFNISAIDAFIANGYSA